MKMRLKVTAVCTLSAALAGCGGMPVQQQVPMTQQFRIEDYTQYLQSGAGVLTGQAFLRQRGGGVVTCAGSPVALLPATPFFREFIAIARMGRTPAVQPIGPEGQALRRQSQCDAQGNFRFEALPSGRYLVATEVAWSAGYERQGGPLLKEIEIASPGSTSTLLTDADFVP